MISDMISVLSLLVVVGLCLTSMLAATMRSAPPSSGQESLKCGRQTRRGDLRYPPDVRTTVVVD
jgi:hypothetical protein